MSEQIDWSKAPDWAKKHGLSGAFKSPVWFDDKKYTYVDGQQDGKEFFYTDACTYAAKDFSQVSERPTTPSWSGEGLPPVGVVCEVRNKTPGCCAFPWEKCTIALTNIGANGCVQICTIDHRGDFAIYYPEVDIIQFRPIRTTEQIAADEREAAILDIYQTICISRAQAEAIYDAGYRKQ